MTDNSVAITQGAGTNIDTRTESTNNNHRQVVVLGDPLTNAGVAPVDVTNGLSMTLTTAIPAGENMIGAAVGVSDVVTLNPSCFAGEADAGDVLADTEVFAAAVRVDDATAIIQSLTVVDKDDVGGGLNIFIFDANVSLGTEGAPISISDGDAASIQAIITVATSDFVDCTNSQVAFLSGLQIPIQPASGSDDLYLAVQAVTGGTYTAAGLTIRLGLLND